MFEMPHAKHVRRQDLYDSASERDSTPDGGGAREDEQALVRAELSARLASLVAIQLKPGPAIEDGVQDEEGVEGECGDGQQDANEFEFRLFSTSAPSQKVVLATLNETYHGPAIKSRPLACYLRGELSQEERAMYEYAAVSAADILTEARKRAWGLEVPWRVTRIAASSSSSPLSPSSSSPSSLLLSSCSRKARPAAAETATEGGGTGGRKRPGKKRRIAIRTREKEKREATAAAEKQKMTKEEHLREKKKRLNRERKLKRKRKDKEKKLAAQGGEAE